MRVLYINGNIDDTVVNTFFCEFNKLAIKENVTIYISSDGGFDHQSLAIIDLINKNASRIELVASGFILSAAFNIFFFIKCKRRLLPETVGMAHFCKQSFTFDETGKAQGEYDNFMLKELKRNKALTLEKLKTIGLSTKELNQVKKGKECYIGYARLQELLEYGKSKKDR